MLFEVKIHGIRHTFAPRLIRQGTDIETLGELLGHFSVTLPQRYSHSYALNATKYSSIYGRIPTPGCTKLMMPESAWSDWLGRAILYTLR